MRHLTRLLCAFAFALAAAALPAFAANITVTKPGDNPTTPEAGSLRDAVAKAQPGDTITVQHGVTVKLKGDLTLTTANVTIQGENPADGKSGQPSKIAPDDPKAAPPKVVVQGGGSTVKNLAFDGVRVVVDKDNVGTKIDGCDFKGQFSGVQVNGAKGTLIGSAPDDPNGLNSKSCSFNGCTYGVQSNGSTDTTIGANKFDDVGTGVLSTDDTNTVVANNNIDAKTSPGFGAGTGDGIVFTGSSGKIDKNTVKPGKKGTAILANKSAGDPKGAVTGEGNNVKLKGNAKGIDTTNRPDAKISRCDVGGKTTGAGFHCSIGPDAGPGAVGAFTECNATGCGVGFSFDCDGSTGATFECKGSTATKCGVGFDCDLGGSTGATCTLDECDAKICGPGFSCDAEGATGATCTASNCEAVDCKIAGFIMFADGSGSFTLTNDTALRCGSGPEACGFNVGGTGGALSCVGIVAEKSKGPGVRTTRLPTICTFESITVALSRAEAINVGAGTFASVNASTFTDNRGPWVFVNEGGTFDATTGFFDGAYPSGAKTPLVDVFPRGWKDDDLAASFDDAGDLTVHVAAGTNVVRICGADPAVCVEKATDQNGDAKFSAGEIPDGAWTAVATFTDTRGAADPLNRRIVREETRVRRPKAKPFGKLGPFTFSATKVTVTSAPGADGSVTIEVTNTSDSAQTLDVGKLTGHFFNSPNGQVAFQPHQTKSITIGHSAFQAIVEAVNLLMKLVDGTGQLAIKVTGVTK